MVLLLYDLMKIPIVRTVLVVIVLREEMDKVWILLWLTTGISVINSVFVKVKSPDGVCVSIHYFSHLPHDQRVIPVHRAAMLLSD